MAVEAFSHILAVCALLWLKSHLGYVFSSILDTVARGLDGSGAFLWCGNLASRPLVSPCGLSRPSTVSRCVLSAMSNVRRGIALRVRSPPWMPLEEARDRTT